MGSFVIQNSLFFHCHIMIHEEEILKNHLENIYIKFQILFKKQVNEIRSMTNLLSVIASYKVKESWCKRWVSLFFSYKYFFIRNRAIKLVSRRTYRKITIESYSYFAPLFLYFVRSNYRRSFALKRELLTYFYKKMLIRKLDMLILHILPFPIWKNHLSTV